jgi:hypothetical protein
MRTHLIAAAIVLASLTAWSPSLGAQTVAAEGPTASSTTTPAPITANEIFERMQRASADRAVALASYTSTRHYAVLEPGHPPDAEMVVSMTYVAPSTKSFKTVSTHGVGWIHRRVFRGLMDAELDAANGKQKVDSSITSANYDAQLMGTEQRNGRDCYVLALKPRHQNKYLFVGKVWIDKEDAAIARVEGEPAKSPSFWVVKAPFVREYQRIGGFWLPARDETHSQIRFAGEYILEIQYADYEIVPKGSPEAHDGDARRD